MGLIKMVNYVLNLLYLEKYNYTNRLDRLDNSIEG